MKEFLRRKQEFCQNILSVLCCLNQVSGTSGNILTLASVPNFQKQLPVDMEGSTVKPTVLDYMLENFKKSFSENYRMRLNPEKLCNLCELARPTFGAGWLLERILALPTVRAVRRVVTGTPGYPDQWLFIDKRLQSAVMVPPWVQFSANRRGRNEVLMAQPI